MTSQGADSTPRVPIGEETEAIINEAIEYMTSREGLSYANALEKVVTRRAKILQSAKQPSPATEVNAPIDKVPLSDSEVAVPFNRDNLLKRRYSVPLELWHRLEVNRNNPLYGETIWVIAVCLKIPPGYVYNHELGEFISRTDLSLAKVKLGPVHQKPEATGQSGAP